MAQFGGESLLLEEVLVGLSKRPVLFGRRSLLLAPEAHVAGRSGRCVEQVCLVIQLFHFACPVLGISEDRSAVELTLSQ